MEPKRSFIMKKFASFATAALAALALSACTTVIPYTATSNSIGSKVGEATYTMILGIPFPFSQDFGIQAAAKNGGITKISTVDLKHYNGLFIQKVTTVVTGE